MYVMLCGYPPFNGDDDKEIIENVKNGDLEFFGNSFSNAVDEEWSAISEDAKALIKKMLKRNPRNRISAKEALQDPWIQNNVHEAPLKPTILQKLTQFNSKNRFRHAIMTFIACQVSSKEELDELKKTFAALDKDGNGALSKDELIKGYRDTMPTMDEEQIRKIVEDIMDQADVNNQGEINFTDFIVAATNREQKMHEEQIVKAFNMLDLDGNGFIDVTELKQAMSGVRLSETEWR